LTEAVAGRAFAARAATRVSLLTAPALRAGSVSRRFGAEETDVHKRNALALGSLVFGTVVMLGAVSFAFAAPREARAIRKAGRTPPIAQYALPERLVLRLEVLETVEAGAYVYLRARSEDGELWLVTPSISAPSSRTFDAAIAARAEHFRSRITDRTFDVLYFGFPLPAELTGASGEGDGT
jgi:hypothetical protein